MGKMVGLIDCDSFFCSCERVFRPDLRHRAVVVLSNNDGCVVARSREAKAMGVKEGLPYFQLREAFPDADITAFSSNYTLYGDMSSRVMSVLASEAPDLAQYSIDEAFLDLEGIDPQTLKQWGESLCRKVERNTGLPVSLGIGPTCTLAKLASHFAKRYPGYNKCCVIATDEQRDTALKLTPVRDVWGIGRRISSTLEYYGVSSAYDFVCRTSGWVRSRFHVTGVRTWAELRGEPMIDIHSLGGGTKNMILTSRSFAHAVTELDDLRSHVSNYAARCAMKLRAQSSVCGGLSVFVRTNTANQCDRPYEAEARHTFATSTAVSSEIIEAAIGLLESVYRDGIRYKKAGVMVWNISPAATLQPDLFSYDPDRRRKLDTINEAIDSINRRLGADTVVLGAQQYRQKTTDGKSVKFVNAIRRELKSPDYTTRLGAFTIRC